MSIATAKKIIESVQHDERFGLKIDCARAAQFRIAIRVVKGK